MAGHLAVGRETGKGRAEPASGGRAILGIAGVGRLPRPVLHRFVVDRILDRQRPEDLVAKPRLELGKPAAPGGRALAKQSGEHFGTGGGDALAGASGRYEAGQIVDGLRHLDATHFLTGRWT